MVGVTFGPSVGYDEKPQETLRGSARRELRALNSSLYGRNAMRWPSLMISWATWGAIRLEKILLRFTKSSSAASGVFNTTISCEPNFRWYTGPYSCAHFLNYQRDHMSNRFHNLRIECEGKRGGMGGGEALGGRGRVVR